MRFFGTYYSQNNQNYISMILPMKYIIDHSEVLVYGTDKKYGYQRAPRRDHYLKITKSLLAENTNLVTPNSIILGLNKGDIDNLFTKEILLSENDETILSLDSKENTDILFRIIDGQHRIKGFQEAIERSYRTGDSKKAHELESYKCSVIVMLLDSNNRLPEVQVFSDINSKAKPLKMDLTILSEYQYMLVEKPNDINSVSEFLLTTVLRMLNVGESVDKTISCREWKNGITFDINATQKVGCIGFKTFLKSLDALASLYIKKLPANFSELDFNSKVSYLDPIALDLYSELARCWNCVFKKWNVTNEKWIYINEESYQIFYNKDYYIQRTMGVCAINNIICNCYTNKHGYKTFKSIIDNCPLTTSDWKIDGKFAGMSSASGSRKIEKAILGDFE